MCCNGVLFQSVVLQPADPVKELKALGFRLKTKREQTSFAQPCTAFRGSSCAVYDKRPQRCRLFNCRQLLKLESAEITEETALGKIEEARKRSDCVKELLLKAGSTNLKRPLATRYELVMAQPVESLTDPLAEIRQKLTDAMAGLEEFLRKEFRIEPAKNAKSRE